ncbi:MAG: HPr(Ser) kinase/phosphatase [Thermoanaerobaculia bacterium]
MPQERDHVLVRELLGEELRDLQLTVLAGEGSLDNRVTNPRVQKPGLAFAGYYDYIKPGRVQIVGESELAYLAGLDDEVRRERISSITALSVPTFVVTKGLAADGELLRQCREREIPLLRSTALSSTVIKQLSFFLEDRLVPTTTVHGVLIDVYGLGVLLIGASGVGKSECALDLISRGHSLVADDRVQVRLYPSGELVGYGDALQRHHMELRGIGIIDVRDLFGLAAVRDRHTVDLVIEMEPWDETRQYDRLGLDETVHEILGTAVPYICMPVALGRNISILVEIAARNHMLKLQGHHSARELVQRLKSRQEANRAAVGKSP